MRTIVNNIEHQCISSNYAYPNFSSPTSELKLLCIVDNEYLRQVLRKTDVTGPKPYISNKYLVELDTFQGKQLFYQMDNKTWLVQLKDVK